MVHDHSLVHCKESPYFANAQPPKDYCTLPAAAESRALTSPCPPIIVTVLFQVTIILRPDSILYHAMCEPLAGRNEG
jgi:hypothetical protein